MIERLEDDVAEATTKVHRLLLRAYSAEADLALVKGENESLRKENERLRGGAGPDDPSACPAGNYDSCCGYHEDCRRSLANPPWRI